MILFLSAQEPLLESPVNERFGRSPWLIQMDTETNQWKAHANPGVNQSGGAGVAAAQFVADQKANVVISGNFGPNAAGAFKAANIEMRLYSADITTVQQAVEYYLQDKLPVYE